MTTKTFESPAILSTDNLKCGVGRCRRLAVKLAYFVLSVTPYALLLWLIFALGLFALGVAREGIATAVLFEVMVIGGCGILCTVPATVGISYLERRRGLPRSLECGLGVAWILVVSTVWWSVTWLGLGMVALAEPVLERSFFAQTWISIPFAGALFYATHAVRRHMALQRATRRKTIDIQRRKAFEGRPKAFTQRHLDVFEITATLDVLRQTYGESRRRGNKMVDLVQRGVTLSSDPRYNLPIPLPIAVEICGCELDLRRELKNWPVTIRIDSVGSFPTDMMVEPAVLCAAGVFAVEYAAERRRRHSTLNITFEHSPIPSIVIRTEVNDRDLWFALDKHGAAHAAKTRLVEVLNQFSPRGTVLECVSDSDGCMAFHISVRTYSAGDEVWENVERTLGQGVELLSRCDLSEGINRVYVEGNVIHKVQLLDHRNRKPLALAEEYTILRQLGGVEGVPTPLDYREYAKFAVLSVGRVDGLPLDQYLANSSFERKVWFRCIAELSALVNRIHKRGVLHRDFRPDNILVGKDGTVHLIDFDQAVAATDGARQVDLRGESCDGIPPCVSVAHLIDHLGLRDEYTAVVDRLRSAWEMGARSNASSPGCNIAYYQWVFGDAELPGERDWFSRWDLVHRALRRLLPGAHILDLGCNLGLVATQCMLYGAARVTAVDVQDDVLEAGRTLARAAGVNIDFVKGDLTSGDFVDSILREREYTLVVALSVMHWLDNREEVVRLLAATPAVLYEGHNPPFVEIKLLRSLGFREVQLIGYSERLRGLYFALK